VLKSLAQCPSHEIRIGRVRRPRLPADILTARHLVQQIPARRIRAAHSLGVHSRAGGALLTAADLPRNRLGILRVSADKRTGLPGIAHE
jgi:hypothetical protein